MKNVSLDENVKHPLNPIYNQDSKILILGTMPSVASRKYGFYYGHPQNRFWKTLASVFSEIFPKSISDKKNFVLRNNIALWDVIKSCNIHCSSDASIKNVIPNDINSLIKKTSITKIYCTGKKACSLYDFFIFQKTGIKSIYLPSTSAANRARWSDEKLIEAYKVIRENF